LRKDEHESEAGEDQGGEGCKKNNVLDNLSGVKPYDLSFGALLKPLHHGPEQNRQVVQKHSSDDQNDENQIDSSNPENPQILFGPGLEVN